MLFANATSICIFLFFSLSQSAQILYGHAIFHSLFLPEICVRHSPAYLLAHLLICLSVWPLTGAKEIAPALAPSCSVKSASQNQ